MRRKECQAAVERVTAYLANPQAADAELDTALEHIRECPDCSSRIGYLVRALHTDAVDRLNCQVCEQRLPEYAAMTAAERAGRSGRAIALHLALCPHCAAVYADLADLVALAEGARGQEPPAYPQPDLAFLGPAPIGSLDALGRLVIAFSADLLRTLRMPAGPAFAAGGLRSDQPAPSELQPFTLASTAPDLDVSIEVEPVRGDPAHCTITVHAGIPSRGGFPRLRGTLVVLRRGDIGIGRSLTDAHGNVVFKRVPTEDLTQLVFTIERGSDA
jgi:hypothetical protein